MKNKEDILRVIKEQGVIPLFYHDDIEVCINVIDALYMAGIRIVEFTNRGEQALCNIKILLEKRNEKWNGLFISAGTIKKEKDALEFISAGVDFIISPGLSINVAKAAHEADILWIPGCMTPTEVMNAEQHGATFVKLFPGNLLGPGFVSSIKEVFPKMSFMPTGGVELNEENIAAWFKSGVTAVGLGSKMISKELLKQKDYSQIEVLAKKALSIITKVKSENS